MAPRRSLMFSNPWPLITTAGSNPAPSSATSNRSTCASVSSATVIVSRDPSPACLPAFCIASRQQK